VCLLQIARDLGNAGPMGCRVFHDRGAGYSIGIDQAPSPSLSVTLILVRC